MCPLHPNVFCRETLSNQQVKASLPGVGGIVDITEVCVCGWVGLLVLHASFAAQQIWSQQMVPLVTGCAHALGLVLDMQLACRLPVPADRLLAEGQQAAGGYKGGHVGRHVLHAGHAPRTALIGSGGPA